MDLYTYLAKHDGKPRPDGPELIRLASSVNRSSYYIYLTALGHKRVSASIAKAMAEASIGGQLEAEFVNKIRN